MSYSFRFLAPDMRREIFEAFLEAFKDYEIDVSQYTQEVYINRTIKNGIDFESSVGLFEGERMVGFTLIGIDTWKGVPSAYDIGTGIAKPHRGKGLARGMFDHALPRLREKGVRRFLLEVLQQNEPAIKAYRRAGFETTREFDCFELEWETIEKAASGTIVGLERGEIGRFENAIDWLPSWENSFAAMRRIPDELLLLGAMIDGEPRGLLAYYPALNWIMCIAVEREYRRTGIGGSLVRHLGSVLSDGPRITRIVNVQHDDTGMIAFLEGLGFEKFISQYEMEMEI